MKSIIRISDGLGNQLFQYAFAYSVYKETGMDIILDPMFISPLRKYQLSQFNLDFKQRLVNEKLDFLLGFGPKKARRPRLQYRDKIIKRKNYKLVKEQKELVYEPGIYSQNEAYYLGFWQSYKYFDRYYDDIKRQFVLLSELSTKAKEYDRLIKTGRSVACHIRRTDYDRNENNVCINDYFYKKSLMRMREQVGDFNLFVFTDDKQFVKNNFVLKNNYTIIEGTTDLEDFWLMQRCQNHIIANSTFSWWGAYLAENKGGIVFAPVAGIWTDNFYLPEWNCIETGIGRREWKEETDNICD